MYKRQAVGASVSLGNQKVFTSPEAGVVVYSTDGYEKKTPEALKESDFDEKAYKKTEPVSYTHLLVTDILPVMRQV